MTHKLVQFVEDRVFHVCDNKDIKEKDIILAKYKGHFYPAIICNEGSKSEMDKWKKISEKNDIIIKKYFKFIETEINPYKKENNRTDCSTQTISSSKDAASQSLLKKETEIGTQTDYFIINQPESFNETPIIIVQGDIRQNLEMEFNDQPIHGSNNHEILHTNIENHYCKELDLKYILDNHSNTMLLHNNCASNEQLLNLNVDNTYPAICENERVKYNDEKGTCTKIDLSRNTKITTKRHSFSDEVINILENTPDEDTNLLENTPVKNRKRRIITSDEGMDNLENTPKRKKDYLSAESYNDYEPSKESSSSSEVSETESYTCTNTRLNANIATKTSSSSNSQILESRKELYTVSENIKIQSKPHVVEANKQQTKLYFCIFCKTKVSRFARHLLIKHKDKKDIIEISNLQAGDPKRLQIITKLRSLGTFEYNTDAKFNEGDIIVARRPQPSKNRNISEYTPCPKCRNFYKNNLLFRHYKRCGNSVKSAPRSLQALSRATLLEDTVDNEWLQSIILPGMQRNDIFYIVKEDKLILTYGKYLCMRHDGEKHLANMIRQKLRTLGYFLQTIRKLDSDITTLESVFLPNKFNNFLKAVQICAGYNHNEGTYRVPTLPNVIGTLLKECGEKLTSNYIKEGKQENISAVQAWLDLYRIEFPLINRNANKVLVRRKWNKPRVFPLTEDIMKLNSYLHTQLKNSLGILSKEFDKVCWFNVAKCTLLLILIFNRKRVGETERLLIADYNNRHNIQHKSESFNSLKPSEQLFSKRYMRIEIRGKLGRPVCMMISHEQVEAINLLLKHRESANVHCNNPYVFGKGDDKFFEGARCLREAADHCGAEQPNLLRGTKLRKHIATVSQALNLTENELAILADYMGHNIEIHRSFYRLPNEAIHLAKISQLLYALDNNIIHKYKGKSLDQIDINDIHSDDDENDVNTVDADGLEINLVEDTTSLQNIPSCSSSSQLYSADQHTTVSYQTLNIDKDTLDNHSNTMLYNHCASNEQLLKLNIDNTYPAICEIEPVKYNDKKSTRTKMDSTRNTKITSNRHSFSVEDINILENIPDEDTNLLEETPVKNRKKRGTRRIITSDEDMGDLENTPKRKTNKNDIRGKKIRTANLKQNKITTSEYEISSDEDITNLENTPETNRDMPGTSSRKRDEWTPNRKRRKAAKRKWTTPEKFAMRKFFAAHLREKYLSSSRECREAIKCNSILRHRNFMQLKLWVNNYLKKNNGPKRNLQF